MNFDDFSPNHMGVVIHCQDDGSLEIVVGHNLKDDFSEELGHEMLNLLQGLNLFLKHHPQILYAHGAMWRELKETWGDEFDEDDLEMMIDFEPDPELEQAVNRTDNVVSFSKKKLH